MIANRTLLSVEPIPVHVSIHDTYMVVESLVDSAMRLFELVKMKNIIFFSLGSPRINCNEK